jgi:hypothetical protein
MGGVPALELVQKSTLSDLVACYILEGLVALCGAVVEREQCLREALPSPSGHIAQLLMHFILPAQHLLPVKANLLLELQRVLIDAVQHLVALLLHVLLGFYQPLQC